MTAVEGETVPIALQQVQREPQWPILQSSSSGWGPIQLVNTPQSTVWVGSHFCLPQIHQVAWRG